LTETEKAALRAKQIYMDDEHFAGRCMYRTSFQKMKNAMLEGEIYREGKNKYRAVLPMKDKLLFVIFRDEGEYLEPRTVGITSRKDKRWG